MRIAQFVLSAIIAFAVVYIVHRNQLPASVKLTSSSNNYSLEVQTVPTALEDSILTIPVKIDGVKNAGIKYFLRYAKPNLRNLEHLHRYGTTPLTAVDSAAGLYKAVVTIGGKGTLSHYFFEVRDPVGRYLTGIKLPDEKPLVTAAVGRVDPWVKYGYFSTMFLAILAVTVGAFGSIRLLTSNIEAQSVKLPFLLASIFLIFSVYMLGNLFQGQLTGTAWQGAPFGTNFGDNFKQFLLVFLAFMVLSLKLVGAKSGGRRTVLPAPVIGYLGIISFFIMIFAYLAPLVVKADFAEVTNIFYAFLALLLAAYLLGFRRSKNA
ncbi:MAG TPA: hypothetical protein VHP63_07475 [candidate division Zixibacteria bacterium]|nr:hypothetical protein [candidate division Zixibacteria bacterium]